MSYINNPNQLREIITMLEKKLVILQEREFSCCEITMSRCHALVEIGRAKSISLNALAELLNLENSTMSRTVNTLVTNKLAKRDIDPNDRRYVTISLTESGKRLFESIEEGMNLYFMRVYDSIPENKRQQVLESMQILVEAISKNEWCK